MAPTPGVIDIRQTFGSAYIGAMVMMILYGITTLQTYMYFIRYPKDPQWTKLLVSSLWILDTFHICLISHAMYHYLVVNYANPLGLASGVWSLFISVGANVVIAFVTQCFFTQRLHNLCGRRWWITGAISLAVVAHFCFGIETTALLFIKKDFSRISEITYNAAMPFAITAVASDIVIAGALCVLLHNSRTGFNSTNTMLNYIIVYAINRCLLTSAVAIVELVTFIAMPHNLWYLAVDFIVGKLYANSLLATLNTRSSLAGKGMEDDDVGNNQARTNTTVHWRAQSAEQGGVDTLPSMMLASGTGGSETTTSRRSVKGVGRDELDVDEIIPINLTRSQSHQQQKQDSVLLEKPHDTNRPEHLSVLSLSAEGSSSTDVKIATSDEEDMHVTTS